MRIGTAGMVHLARCRVGVSRRRPSPRALCERARLRRDQLLVPPQPPRRGLPALGRADAAWLSLLGQAAARHQPRRATASCPRAAAAIPGRSRRPGRSPRAAAGAAAAVVRVRGAGRATLLRLARRPVRGRCRLRAAPSELVHAGGGPSLIACGVGRVSGRSGALSASAGPGRAGSAETATAVAPSSTTVWHGSPRMYWSRYDLAWLRARADALKRWPRDADRWCIFDDTAGRRRDLERARASHPARRRTQSLAVVALPVFLHREHALRADRAPRREPRGERAGRDHRGAQRRQAQPRAAAGPSSSGSSAG